MLTVLAYDLFDYLHLLIFAECLWVVEAGSRSPNVRNWAAVHPKLAALKDVPHLPPQTFVYAFPPSICIMPERVGRDG